MKSKLLIILAVIAICLPVLATDNEPIRGSSTNLIHYVTNSVGDLYIISCELWGSWDGATDITMEMTYNGLSTPMIFNKSSAATNSLTYTDGDGGMQWPRLAVITLKAGGDTITTNAYRIQTTTKPRK